MGKPNRVERGCSTCSTSPRWGEGVRRVRGDADVSSPRRRMGAKLRAPAIRMVRDAALATSTVARHAVFRAAPHHGRPLHGRHFSSELLAFGERCGLGA